MRPAPTRQAFLKVPRCSIPLATVERTTTIRSLRRPRRPSAQGFPVL